jgi:uncharacterized pyridoxamine 5'-phosphate oxidase family protein
MNKKFVYQVGNNNKKSYTMMQGQPNIEIVIMFVLSKFSVSLLDLNCTRAYPKFPRICS